MNARLMERWKRFGTSRGRARSAVIVGFCAVFFAVSCGPELDPISTIETVRLIGMRKSAPYARPGEQVDLHLLWEEGRSPPPEKVETFFAFWCLNPPGDLFSECLRTPPGRDFDVQFQTNQNTFTLEIPEDSLRSSIIDPRLPDSGTAFVFYGICTGTLAGPGIGDDADIPFTDLEVGEDLIPKCLDEEGNELGADDFIIGYSAIFIYEELRNANPMIIGFTVEGQDVTVDCTDTECDAQFSVPEIEGCQQGVPCLQACEDDGDFLNCPGIEIGALLHRDSAEKDEVAEIAYGTDIEEAIWVSYFVDRGSVSPPVKLVNDATVGWQDDYTTKIYAPKEPGPLRIWAAARDNRGGISWTRTLAYVE